MTLPCEVKEDSQCIAEWKIHGTKRTVAQENSTKRFEGQGFERIRLNSADHSLTITSTVYNDMASYECVCGKHIVDVKLVVQVPSKISALVGENATIPCYGMTDKLTTNDNIHVKWRREDIKSNKKEKVIFVEGGIATVGCGFEKRAVVSLDAFRTGDIALHISNVSVSDQGSYLCSFGTQHDQGYPSVIYLEVDQGQQPRHRDTSTTATPPSEPFLNTTCVNCDNGGCAVPVAVTVTVACIVAGIVAFICYKLGSKQRSERCRNEGLSTVRQQNVPSDDRAGQSHSDIEMQSQLLNQSVANNVPSASKDESLAEHISLREYESSSEMEE